MRRLFLVGAIATVSVAVASISWATNLNSSRSNIYRVIYDTEAVTPDQASALLGELDKLGPADEAKLKRWLPANFKKHGIQADQIKKIVILPANNACVCVCLVHDDRLLSLCDPMIIELAQAS
jgi:hypothetical protein